MEEESTTGFDLVLDGTLAFDVEFNWIAVGVEEGVVSVSDGTSVDIEIYVVDTASSDTSSNEEVSTEEAASEETASDEAASDESAATEEASASSDTSAA